MSLTLKEIMKDNSEPDKQNLIWPSLFDPDEFDYHGSIENITLTTNKESIEELLFEIGVLHSHVSEKLKLLIGHPEFETEIKNLVINNRNDRQGFSKFVLDHILKLYHLHVEKYGLLKPVIQDSWEQNHLK